MRPTTISDHDDIVTAAAEALMESVFEYRREGRGIHLAVITESRKMQPTVRYEWQRKNVFGVSFPKHKAKAAEQWAIEVIRAGYRPHYLPRKNGTIHCPSEVCKLLSAHSPPVPSAK